MNAHATERLTEDLAAIAKDAEALFGGSDDNLAERAKEIRDRLAEALEATDKTIKGLNNEPPSALGAIDQMIRDKPYHAVGLAVGVGLILGLLLKRK
jgi:ElaB/YqjD/DUF883 family membrane-anchored ribosome-binding protein